MSETSETGNDIEEKCLKDLKTKITKDSNFNKSLAKFDWLIDDRFLLHFVRGKKLNADKAAVALKNYFQIREHHEYKHLFLDLRDLTHVSNTSCFENGAVKILKYRDDQGKIFVVFRFSFWTDTKIINLDSIVKHIVLCIEECWNCTKIEKNGMLLIVDLESFGWEHAKCFSPRAVYNAVNVFWQNMPMRFRNIHMINGGYIFEITLKAIRLMLPKTLRERLVIHPSGFDTLHKEICPSYLPKSLGGQLSEENAHDSEFIQRICNKGEHYRRFADCLL